jgi:hypothetical protein
LDAPHGSAPMARIDVYENIATVFNVWENSTITLFGGSREYVEATRRPPEPSLNTMAFL